MRQRLPSALSRLGLVLALLVPLGAQATTAKPPAALPDLRALCRSEWSSSRLMSAHQVASALMAAFSVPSLVPRWSDSWPRFLSNGFRLGMATVEIVKGIGEAGQWALELYGKRSAIEAAGAGLRPLTEAELRFLARLDELREAIRIGAQAKGLDVLKQLAKEHTGHPLFLLLLAQTHASVGPAWDPERAGSLLSQFLAATTDKKVAEAAAAKGWNVQELFYYHEVLTRRKVDALGALRTHAEALAKKMVAKSPQVENPDHDQLQAAVETRTTQARERLAELEQQQQEVADLERRILAKQREIDAARRAKGKGQDVLTVLSSERDMLKRKLSGAKTGATNAKSAWERQQKFIDLCAPKLAELQRERRRT